MRVCSGAARVRTHHTQATMIFRAKANRVKRDSLSAELAAEFGITSKAVRDIWNLRTWTWTTMPYWTQADHDDFLPKHLCENCKVEHKAGNVRVLSDACARCANPPPLGRPALDSTVPFGSIGFSETAHVEEAQAVMETEAGAATDPAHHFAQSCFLELTDGDPAGPTFEAIPSFSDIFCVASPQELLDGKGISESEA